MKVSLVIVSDLLECGDVLGVINPVFRLIVVTCRMAAISAALSSILVKFVNGEGALMLRGGEMLTAEQLVSWVDVDVGVDVGLKAVVISG